MPEIVVAICTYNRAGNLPKIIEALADQVAPLDCEVLFVNNNSTDETAAVLQREIEQGRAFLRVVTEHQQGIVFARNRALMEARGGRYLIFFDDDELPQPGFVAAAVDALTREGAQVVGGRVLVDFSEVGRPSWLGDELLGFLAHSDYGDHSFWIDSEETPLWTANVGYDLSIFDDGLSFDQRYNRAGKDIGGGEDVAMFQEVLARGYRIRYRPEMVVHHYVEPWRLRRSYFLRLHYRSGIGHGLYRFQEFSRNVGGVPLFLLGQALRQLGRSLRMLATRDPYALRQMMNFTYDIGCIVGCYRRHRIA